jgi:ABC-type glycerol-3-phosphate transport system substrate-binding protein
MRRILSLFLLVTLLAACSGAPDQPNATPPPNGEAPTAPAGDSNEDTKVTISFAAWDYERQTYEPLVKKFTEENPNINVALVPLDDLMNVSDPNADYSALAQLRRIVSGADTAPAFAVAPETFGSGLLLDLKPQMEADASFQADDFLPGALEQYTVKGGTWLLPRYINVQLLNYNKELFKNAGLPDPKPGWGWNDLLGAAEQLAVKSGSKVSTYGYLDNSGGFLPLVSLLQERNVDLLNTPAAKIQLDSPEIIEAVERVRALTESGALFRPVYKEGPPDEFTDPTQLVRDGKVAIWDASYVPPVACDGPDCNPQQTEFSFPVGKLPYPSSIPGFFYGGTDGYIISAGTAHPAESWKWIEWLSRQQVDQGGPRPIDVAYNPPGRVPARVSIADQSGFWTSLDAETAAAYKWAIANPMPSPERTPDYTVLGALGQALEQILGTEQKDPRKALQDAQRQMQDQIAQTQLTPTPVPNTSPVVVATPEPQLAPEGATTINFSPNVYNPPDLRRLARAFRDQRPDVFVNVTSTEVYTQAPTFKQIASTSDCFAWYNAPQSDEDFAALLDLQPLFDADASFPQSDYAPALLSAYQRGGGLYGLPYAATLRTLNFNRTAFDAAGIQTPTFKWTPDDFLAAAQALTKGDGDAKQFGYIPLSGVQQDFMFFINQFGGRLVTGSGQDARPTFTDPKTVEALKWYIDLANVHKVMPELKFYYMRDQGGFEDKSYEMIQNGRAGMWFDQGYGMFGGPSGSPVKGGRPGEPGAPQQNFEVGIAPLPVGRNGLTSNDLFARGLHISASTDKAQACWEWLKFLSSDISNLQGAIPARTSVLQSDAFKKQATPDVIALAETYADALKQSRPASQSSDPNAFYMMDTYWFFKALDDAAQNKAPLDQALAEAQEFTTKWMECLQQQPNKPATCAAQTDPDYKGFNTEDPQMGPGGPGIGIPRG